MADDRPNVQKAKIVNLNNNQSLTCHFNPDTFTLKRSLDWKLPPKTGDDYPEPVFSGGQAQDFELKLLFDTTSTGSDVRDEYAALTSISKVDPDKKDTVTKKGEPPRCRFEWGRFLTFEAVITDLQEEFMMFKPDGTPLRAQITVKFKQVASVTRGQNPTTRTEPRKVWVVHEGQTLDWIAYQEYGDPAQWRHIAETNELADPLDIKPGQVLKLVPLP